MIFWALITIIVAVTTTAVVRSIKDQYNDTEDHAFAGFVAFFISVLASIVVFFVSAIFINPTSRDVARDDTYQLRAIGTASGVEGRAYFLGGGYINSKRVLNYITDENGAIRVQQSNADVSTIYEDATQPTVNVKHYDERYGWLMPFVVPTHEEYTFHIPAGSVMSDYTVTNK